MSDIIQFEPLIPADERAYDVVKNLTTEQLKLAWDRWTDDDKRPNRHKNDPGCFILEAIHAEMNERGQGHYVAV